MARSDSARPCKRCKGDAPYLLRADPTCRECYIQYVASKMNKRLGVLHKDTRTSRALAPRRYLAGLSFGPSSSALAQLLDESAKRYSNNKSTSAFEMLIVHVDTNLSYPGAKPDTPARILVDKYREQFPRVQFEYVHLSKVLGVKSVDWGTLPIGEEGSDEEKLRVLFDKLPTATARADILRLLVRHLLLHLAIEKGYSALLLGHSTTALAALTLAEVANGRGFAVPWQVNDGLSTICAYEQDPSSPGSKEAGKIEFPVYYPLREIFRNEIIQYVNLIPALEDLVSKEDETPNSVVSHKDLSIEEVMTRYFRGVEGSYSGIVANVVKTTGKLDRAAADGFCGSCGMPLDEQGDATWAGELGDDPGEISGPGVPGQLCYGCKRSIHG